MNKKLIICSIIALIILVGISATALIKKPNATTIEITNTEENKMIVNDIVQEQITEIEKGNIDMIKIKVNNNVLEVDLEDNEATKSLVERLKNGDIIINVHEYGGFEKVGNLGFSLPREDTNIKTSAGDIVLYQGNQISIFYNSNSWSYTKLGKIKNVSSNELKNILGNGDTTIIFTLSK